MRRRVFLLAGAGAALIGAPLRAQGGGETFALSGDRFRIGEQEFILADIIAPPLYTLHDKSPAKFEESKAALDELLSAGSTKIVDVLPKTRWNARIVLARLNDEITIQEKLVAAGAARVSPQTDDLDFIDRLLTIEATARAARRGLWADNAYKIFGALDATDAIGAFHLVEGVVLRAALARSRFYLNFGENYRTDFTAGARSALYRKWRRSGFDLAALEGARARVRGFVEDINGPSIDVRHVKQIEML